MKSKLPLHLHEILFSSSVPEESRKINALVKKGALKKLASKIFTSNLEDAAEDIIKRNIILGLEKEFVHLNKLIGAMLRTNSAVQLTSPGSRARAQGVPYDAKRNELFINLFVVTRKPLS